jgi:Ca2+-transporting ATPase
MKPGEAQLKNGDRVKSTSGGQAADPWHAFSLEAVLHQLGTSISGLSSKEVVERRERYGSNELQDTESISPWQILFGQFKSLIVWILIVAGIVSAFLGELVDAMAIMAIVALNAVIGFYQEYNAEKSIAALRRMTAPQAKVMRDGKVTMVAATDVVPGDILELESGDLVAADARLLSSSSLRCVESTLTGESEAVDKQIQLLTANDVPLGDRSNMVFMGTSVATGQGRAVVVGTAMDTELGRIAGLIKDAGASGGTPLQQKLEAFGRVLVWASLFLVAMLFIIGLARGMKLFELFMTSVSLAVAAVPEGLPAVVTVALGLGVLRMSRRRALVRRLPSVETLGSTSVICTDKTGTLTVGQMTVREIYAGGEVYIVTGEGYSDAGAVTPRNGSIDAVQPLPLSELATVLVGCNNAHVAAENGEYKVAGDPTEAALLIAGRKLGCSREKLDNSYPKHSEIPFDSDRKRRSVIRVGFDGLHRALVNGAPDELLPLCTHICTQSGVRPLMEEDRTTITEQNRQMADRALRVLGSAYGEFIPGDGDLTASAVERGLVFVGLTGMYDPPRAEARTAVAKCRDAGVRVVMITGDHPHTAIAIARDLGIAEAGGVALSGTELDAFCDEELSERVHEVPVYARVTAAHKLRIIRAWKSTGAVVAMTGDGVNDAPAIKGADIGIAMGRSGTEVTKQASDMVITDDNFASIVAAVEEGRGIYDNIRKTLQYLLAGNCGELLLMTAAIVVGLPMPLLAIHLLWINLVTDGLPALCLATDPISPDVMKQPPRNKDSRITDGGFIGTMLLTGLLTAGVSFAVFIYELRAQSLEVARTHAFAVLVFAELLRAFGARSETRTVWQMGIATNLRLLAVVAVTFAIQIASHHSSTLADLFQTTTLSAAECLDLVLISLVPLLVLETIKLLRQGTS